jgi:hypothetical protein
VQTRIIVALLSVCAVAAPAFAQAPPAAPLVLQLPATARAAALGDAWVTGRDSEVIFYNPAQIIGASRTFGVTLGRPGPGSTSLTAANSYAAGKYSLTLGWGARLLDFRLDAAAAYPYTADDLLTKGTADGQSLLLTFGGAIVYRNFRIGGAAKFLSDRVSSMPADPVSVSINQHAWVADVGVARNLWGGVAAFSAQNLGRTTAVDATTLITPRQFLAGYSWGRGAGPLDLNLYGQVTMRKDWWSPAGGVEVGYGWIEGYNVTLRAGVRRPVTSREQPIVIGAALNADRLTVEYGVQFFENAHPSHLVTVRWR